MTTAQLSAACRLRLALPKGRIATGVETLLRDAGIALRVGARSYRPQLDLPGVEAKLLKPQNIAQMLAAGSRDLGFTGADWVAELDADVVEVLDTGLDPVRVVAAAAPGIDLEAARDAPLRVASEYVTLTEQWIADRSLDARSVRTWGATEVFPPDDADIIVDNTATGSTLEKNGLEIVQVLLRSSTRLYASREAWSDPARRSAIEAVAMLLRSVFEARRRVLIELNVSEGDLGDVVRALPAMKEPTVSPLHGSSGFAVRAAVPRDVLAALIPRLKSAGGSDLLVSRVEQILP